MTDKELAIDHKAAAVEAENMRDSNGLYGNLSRAYLDMASRLDARAAVPREPTVAMVRAYNLALAGFIEKLPEQERIKAKRGGYRVKHLDKIVARWTAMWDAAIHSPFTEAMNGVSVTNRGYQNPSLTGTGQEEEI